MDETKTDERVAWADVFEATADLNWPQPLVCIPLDLYHADRDEIVTAARRHGFSRMLATGDKSNAHFCRYV